MQFNDFTLTGNVTRDPELNVSKNLIPICKFGVAHNNRINVGGEWKDGPPLFLDCVAFKDVAERFNAQAQKGSSVTLQGSLSYETWEAKDGSGKRSKHTMKVNRFSVDKRGRELAGETEETEAELVGAASGGSGNPRYETSVSGEGEWGE